MHTRSDQGTGPAPADGQAPDNFPRWAVPFASGLIAYVTIGMGTLLWMASTTTARAGLRLTPVSVAVIAVSLAFALFARFVLRWYGFLAGALFAFGLVTALALALVWLVKVNPLPGS